MPVLGQDFLTLKSLRPRLKKILQVILAHILFDVNVVGIVVVGPEILFQKTGDPDCQEGAVRPFQPVR